MMHRHGLDLSRFVGVSVLVLAGPSMAGPIEDADRERIYRQDALAHARAITTAWQRLEDYVRNRAPAPETWSDSIPPLATGWLPAWTARGLRARWCDNVLLVYFEPANIKGVGSDQRSVQAAPHLYGSAETRGRVPVLHWLVEGTAEGSVGRPQVALPDCMNGPEFSDPLPVDRAALARPIPDPFRVVRTEVTREQRTEPCPDGQHGEGRTLIREARQDINARNQPAAALRHGPWQLQFEDCRADRAEWEHFVRPCRWIAGPPHNREMTGQEIWRRRKLTTAEGIRYETPERISSTCWTEENPDRPIPVITVTSWTETSLADCPSGETGNVVLTRTVTRRATRFPWDRTPVVQTTPGPWQRDSSNCEPVPVETEPDDPEEDDPETPNEDPADDGGEEISDPEPGDDTTDTGSGPAEPGDGQDDSVPDNTDTEQDDGGPDDPDNESGDSTDVEAPDDTGEADNPDDGGSGDDEGSDGSTDSEQDDDTTDVDDDAGFGDDDTDGDESGDGGDDSCFLTTAVVERRSDEGDDGPTLATLRQFRDGYMMGSPDRRALVSLYYRIAPVISAAIPDEHPDWELMGARIDAAAAAVRSGRNEVACNIYAALVQWLARRWYPEAAPEAANLSRAAGCDVAPPGVSGVQRSGHPGDDIAIQPFPEGRS